MKKNINLLIVTLVALLAACNSQPQAPEPAYIDQSIAQVPADTVSAQFNYPDFMGVAYPSGERTRLSEVIGGRVALVDFWASWCGPCRHEIAENLVRIHEQYKDRGLVVVGVDINDRPDNHATISQQLGITYPQLIDANNVAADLYGFNAIPYIVLIDAQGNIVARDLRGKAIEEALLKVLGE